jgi:hypothetical protein
MGRGQPAITHRALRYRANAYPPPGRKTCCPCGSSRNVEIEHVNWHEEDLSLVNLFWTWRACNLRCWNTLRRAGPSRLTRQYSPSRREPRAWPRGSTRSRYRSGEVSRKPTSHGHIWHSRGTIGHRTSRAVGFGGIRGAIANSCWQNGRIRLQRTFLERPVGQSGHSWRRNGIPSPQEERMA